jgi:MFS family permease
VPTKPGSETSFRFRDVALAAYAPSLVNAIGYGAVTPIVALRARELGADVGTAAFVVALMGIGQLCSSLPSGALVARIGERRTLVVAGSLDAAAMVLATSARSVVVLGVAIALSGMLWTAFLQARQGFMIDAVPLAFRARALSALGGSMRVGIFVGPLLGAGLIQLSGIPAVFVLAAVMSLASGLLALAMPDLSAESRAGGARPQSVWSVIGRHRFVLLTVGTSVVVLGASRTARQSLLPLWADHIGLSPAHTSLVFGLAAFIDMAFFYPGGWLTDRYGRAVTAVAVTAAIATGVLLLPLTQGAVGLSAVAALMAVGNGLGSGIVMTVGADHAPLEGRAQFLGAWRLCGDLGGSVGPLVISLVASLAPLAVACAVVGMLGWAGTGWVGYWIRRVSPPEP